MSNNRKPFLVLSLAAAGLLSACFGGGDDADDPVVPPPPPAVITMVPASALASASAYTQFAITQSATSSETDEPLSASNVDPAPSSETDEPVALG